MAVSLPWRRLEASATSGVYETKCAVIARAAPLLVERSFGDGLAGGADPLLPLLWALRWMVGVEEKLPAGRAQPLLLFEQSQAEIVQGRWSRPATPIGPVLGQSRVVRRRRSLDHLVSDDQRPGMLDQVGAAVAVAENPAILPGLVIPGEVPVANPVLRLLRVGVFGPLVGELPPVTVQLGERLAGDHRPVVGRPPPHDGGEPLQHHDRVRSSQRPQLGSETFTVSSDGRLARLDQQLA